MAFYYLKKIKNNKIVKNTSYTLSGKVLAMIFLVLLDITIARTLPVNNYAEWVFFFSILTMLFYVGWMGINISAKVHISRCAQTKERDNYFYASLMLRVIASVFISALIITIMPNIAGYLGYPVKYPELKGLLNIASILVFFNSFTEYFKEIFIGLQQYRNLFIITTCEYIGYFLFSVLFLYFMPNIWAIALGYITSGVCIFFLSLCIVKKDIGLQFKNANIRYKNYIIPVIRYAFPIMIISFGALILVEMDTFMLGLLSSKAEVATYNIAKNICAKATHVNYALTVGVMTSFSILTKENIENKRKQFNKINIINVLITISISIAILLFSTVTITILYGIKYITASTIMRLLVPYYALYSVSNFYSSFLDFRGKAKFRSICYVSIIVINLVLNYLFIPLYGAKGAAIATDISLVPYTILVISGTFRHFAEFKEQRTLKDGKLEEK